MTISHTNEAISVKTSTSVLLMPRTFVE